MAISLSSLTLKLNNERSLIVILIFLGLRAIKNLLMQDLGSHPFLLGKQRPMQILLNFKHSFYHHSY